MKIALFGGAFDPPHIGHVLCAAYALQVAELDALWVLPSATHPYGKPMQAFGHRMDMSRLAFADLAAVEVRDDELRNDSGRTVDLLTMLREREPGHDWHLIGGSDTERDMPNWYRGAELLAMVSVIPVPRRGYDDEHPAALPAISSTMVREQLAAGHAVDDLVPRGVAAYIAHHGLYATRD